LDDDDYNVRENSSKDLKRLGEAVVKTLKEAPVAAKSAEQRERLDEVLRSEFVDNSGLMSNQLRTLRVIRILEWSRTEEARAVLQALSKQVLEAGLNDYANAALARLAKRATAPR
jgi:hypothetical protein